MGELESALDALEADDLHALGAEGVLDRTAMLVRAANRIHSLLARTVRVGDLIQAPERDGQKTMKSWVRGHLRLSARESHRLVANGRALEQLPALAAACAQGAVSAEQVTVLAPVVAPDALAKAAEQGVDLAEVDTALTAVAVTQVHAALVRAVGHYLARLDPDGSEPDPTEERSLWLVTHADGSVTGRFDLDAVGGEKVQAALESFVQADRPAGDLRTRAQQLGDAVVQWADVSLASGKLPVLRTVKPHVFATIPLIDLADSHTGPAAARTGFGATISAARARWLACDGAITRIVIGPEGQPLDLGRTHRVSPPHLRRAVEHRDHDCVFTGCDAPSWWCDVHHLIHWIDGGDTSLENSALLCERHHTKVHHGFRVERQPDGRWRTWRPDGTEILVGSPLLAV